MEHSFTSIIQTTLEKHFKENADTIFSLNDLLHKNTFSRKRVKI